MTDIVVTAAKVAGQSDTRTRSYKAAATITAGQALYITTAGTVNLADASTGGGVAIQWRGIALNGGYTGDPIRMAFEGPVEGFGVSGLNVEAPLYLSNTAGAIADAAGDASLIVGRVSMRDDGTKFLWVDPALTRTTYS
jgi:hypothetical protein